MTEETNGQPKCHLGNLGGEELIENLKKEGWNPQECDASFRYTPLNERVGGVFMACEPFEEQMMLPQELMPLFPSTGITMTDDSMTAAGISKGDVLILVCNAPIYDGKVVLSMVDGNYMVRFYFGDGEGNKWLLSKNEGVEPICISDRDDVKIIARVLRYVSDAPSMSYSECNKLTKTAKRTVEKPKVASKKHAQWVIRQLGPKVKGIRDWFSFYRPLVQYSVVKNMDYQGFCKLIKDTLPDHKPQPKYDEIQRIDYGCFRKPVEEWTPWSSPFKQRNRFVQYQEMAETVIRYLELEEKYEEASGESYEDLTKSHEKMT